VNEWGRMEREIDATQRGVQDMDHDNGPHGYWWQGRLGHATDMRDTSGPRHHFLGQAGPLRPTKSVTSHFSDTVTRNQILVPYHLLERHWYLAKYR
jgi:hypothetical protein